MFKNWFSKKKEKNSQKDIIYNKEKNELIKDKIIYILNHDEKTASIKDGRKLFGNICIPKSIKYNGVEYFVTVILKSAFLLSNIFEVKFEKDSKLEILEDESFYNCAIRSIELPRHVKKIGDKAF